MSIETTATENVKEQSLKDRLRRLFGKEEDSAKLGGPIIPSIVAPTTPPPSTGASVGEASVKGPEGGGGGGGTTSSAFDALSPGGVAVAKSAAVKEDEKWLSQTTLVAVSTISGSKRW